MEVAHTIERHAAREHILRVDFTFDRKQEPQKQEKQHLYNLK